MVTEESPADGDLESVSRYGAPIPGTLWERVAEGKARKVNQEVPNRSIRYRADIADPPAKRIRKWRIGPNG